MSNWRYDGSECQADQWLWMPDHERRLWPLNYGEMVALNAKLRIRWLWKPNYWEMVYAWLWIMDLNAELWTVALNTKLQRDDGSESLNVNDGSEHQIVERSWRLWMSNYEQWLWTPNYGEMTTLNAWTWTMALNAWIVDKSWQLWMPNYELRALNTKLWRNDDSVRLNVDDGSECLNCG